MSGLDVSPRIMNPHARVRPSKLRSKVGVAIGSALTLAGILFVIPEMVSTEGPIWFGVLWTLVALGVTIFYAANAFTDHGIATDVVEFDREPPGSAEERLETLSRLRSNGVITDDEYASRKSAILDEI